MLKELILNCLRNKLNAQASLCLSKYISYTLVSLGFILLLIANIYYYQGGNIRLLLGTSALFTAIGIVTAIIDNIIRKMQKDTILEIFTQPKSLARILSLLETINISHLLSSCTLRLFRFMPQILTIFTIWSIFKKLSTTKSSKLITDNQKS